MLIFLDIDGVMVPAKGWTLPELLDDQFPAFSTRASRALQRLITTDTTVILTTSHKSNYTIDEWKAIFKKRGIAIEKLQRLDNNANNLSRKEELINWFSANSVMDSFIIIDDDTSLNALPDFAKKNLLLTSPFVGLTEDHLKDIEVMLGNHLQSA